MHDLGQDQSLHRVQKRESAVKRKNAISRNPRKDINW